MSHNYVALSIVGGGRIFEDGQEVDVTLLDRCEAIRHVDSLQPPFSLINRAAANKEIPWCASHDTGVIVYSPMQSGLLTDSFTAERVSSLTDDDWRRRAPEFQPPRLGRNLRLREALRPIEHREAGASLGFAVWWGPSASKRCCFSVS